MWMQDAHMHMPVHDTAARNFEVHTHPRQNKEQLCALLYTRASSRGIRCGGRGVKGHEHAAGVLKLASAPVVLEGKIGSCYPRSCCAGW